MFVVSFINSFSNITLYGGSHHGSYF